MDAQVGRRGQKPRVVEKWLRSRFSGNRWGGTVGIEAVLTEQALDAVAVQNRPIVALGGAQILCTTFFQICKNCSNFVIQIECLPMHKKYSNIVQG
jgi:hypothetical protein